MRRADLPILVVFDFDHTLITKDSFFRYLSLFTGWPRLIVYLIRSLFAYGLMPGTLDRPYDFSTAIKAFLIRYTLSGVSRTRLHHAANNLKAHISWNEKVVEILRDHVRQGHQIIIASGGLDLYLPIVLHDIPYQALLCTKVTMHDDQCEGRMTDGNCVRGEKARQLKIYIEKFGPFSDTWGYGNLPDDRPMLQLLNHQIVISRHEIIDITNQHVS